MLYVSTRNKIETHTAHRALFAEKAPDGGFFAPFRMPVLSQEEISGSAEQRIACVLNKFFDTELNGDDITEAIGDKAFTIANISQRLIFAETYHNATGNIHCIIENLHFLLTGQRSVPNGWVCVAIKIALLFGIFADIEPQIDGFDIALPADDYTDLIAALYAKKMGLTIDHMICVCNHNSRLWDLVNRGEYTLSAKAPEALENFIYHTLGNEEVFRLLESLEKHNAYVISQEQTDIISSQLFVAVVSDVRIDTVAANMFTSNQYAIAADAALAYAGLQDYRSETGINKYTVILAGQKPV